MKRYIMQSLTGLLGLLLASDVIADEGLKIAVVDSGFNGLTIFTQDIPLCKDGHRNLLTNRDDLGDDDDGHGTAVTKLIHDGSGGIKRCFLIYKVFGNGPTTHNMIASAITFAVKRGAKVINLSLGGPGYSKSIDQALKFAAKRKVMVFIAAGNSAENFNEICNTYPACNKGKNLRIVGALDYTLKPAEYSNRGLHVTNWEYGDAFGMQGTSFASPRAAARHIRELNE